MRLVIVALAACSVLAPASPAWAQDIEPRSYSNAPIGVNFLIAGYAYTRGGIAFGSQLPISNPNLESVQANAIYSFRSGIWGSLDATYFTGGRTTLEGVLNSDLQQNWRIGATLAIPVNRENSIKFHASSGVSSRTGNDYDLIGLAWQYRWGGGI